MKYEYFTCWLAYITNTILYSWDTSNDSHVLHINATHKFQYIEPMFQGVTDNTG